MDLEDVFPEDPFEPTVGYLAVNQTPFTVPWAKGRVRLCAGFNTQRAQGEDLFMRRAAFRDIATTPLQYRECQATSITDESSTNTANSSENRSFAFSASVGGSFLGASGRGSYEKSVRDNKNTSNISVRADHACGQIDLIHVPELGTEAVRLLSTASDPVNEFRLAYGDFYVAGCRIGAVNNTTIFGELANKAFFEGKRAEIKVKVLFATIHHSVNEVSRSGSDEGGLRVAAFDSLTPFYSNFVARTFEDSLRAGDVAFANRQRAMTIAHRATEILRKEFSLGRDAVVYQDVVDRLCDRGVVTELMLAPFGSLREYQSLLSRRFNRR